MDLIDTLTPADLAAFCAVTDALRDSVNDATDADASARDDGTLCHDRLLSEDVDSFNPHITGIRRCAPSSRASGVYPARTSRPLLRVVSVDDPLNFGDAGPFNDTTGGMFA